MLTAGIYLLAATTEARKLLSVVPTKLFYRWVELLLAS